MAVYDDLPLGSQRMYSTTTDSRNQDANSQETSIKIAIADDYPVLLAGMRQFLAPCEDIVVLAECTRVADLLEEVALKKPDIILLGCETHLENLAQQLHSIAELHSEGKVIVFTGNLSSNFHGRRCAMGQKVYCSSSARRS